MPRPKAPDRENGSMRLHFVVEWAAKRGLTQSQVASELGIDKSSVSRWFAGRLPSETHLIQLAALFGIEVPSLFRHPDDDWLAQLFAGRKLEEIERMRKTLEFHFPKKVA